MANGLSVPLKSGVEGAYDQNIASAARSANGNGNPIITYGPITGAVLYIPTSNPVTSPSLVVKLQDSPDGGTTWYDVAATSAITTATTTALRINLVGTPCCDTLRIAWTLSGGTITFDVRYYLERA